MCVDFVLGAEADVDETDSLSLIALESMSKLAPAVQDEDIGDDRIGDEEWSVISSARSTPLLA